MSDELVRLVYRAIMTARRDAAEPSPESMTDAAQARDKLFEALAAQSPQAAAPVAWLNTKYRTLHHASGIDTCADVRELQPLYAAPQAPAAQPLTEAEALGLSPSVCRAMALFYTKLAENKDRAAIDAGHRVGIAPSAQGEHG